MSWRHLLGGALGLVGALVLAKWSRLIINEIQEHATVQRKTLFVQIACGIVTGVSTWNRSLSDSIVFCVVAALLVVQLPIDLSIRRLARAPTFLAVPVILTAIVLDSRGAETSHQLVQSLVVASLITVTFGAIHYVKPTSLGLGDVFLAVPLVLSIASQSVTAVAVWLLCASCSGSLHGVFLRWRKSGNYLPFGPHMLFAAWALIYSASRLT